MDRAKMTQRQKRVFSAIVRFWKRHSYAPSTRDLQAELEFACPQGVRCHLVALRDKGWIDWTEHEARSIRPVCVDGQSCPVCGRGGRKIRKKHSARSTVRGARC